MTSIESINEDWRELRSRVDSIANAVFLVAGGALSLSISVILGNKTALYITTGVSRLATCAWYFLFSAIVLFLLLKAHLVFQAFLSGFKPSILNKHLLLLNTIGWLIGTIGFISFTLGLWLMVKAAAIAVRI
jgi:hypothetical protein